MGPNNTKNSPLNVNFSYLTMDNIAIILFYCKKNTKFDQNNLFLCFMS
jgi:hypothetical protein